MLIIVLNWFLQVLYNRYILYLLKDNKMKKKLSYILLLNINNDAKQEKD
jgi:hypothetical protein